MGNSGLFFVLGFNSVGMEETHTQRIIPVVFWECGIVRIYRVFGNHHLDSFAQALLPCS